MHTLRLGVKQGKGYHGADIFDETGYAVVAGRFYRLEWCDLAKCVQHAHY
ncbi:MAG TPA: hypothetical protein PLD79_00625 [Halothiobacillus sp.]|nr:hypothetical protein [Halothiobacillus sp.]